MKKYGIFKECAKNVKLKEEFGDNVDGDITNPDMNAQKIYKVLQGYISQISQTLANRNAEYYMGDKFGDFDARSYMEDMYKKLKSKVKSRTENDKLLFENIPVVKDEKGYYEVTDFSGTIEFFISDITKMETEKIINVLVGKTLRGA